MTGMIICYILSFIGLLGALIFESIAEAMPITVFNWASVVSDCFIVLVFIPWIIWYLYNHLKK